VSFLAWKGHDVFIVFGKKIISLSSRYYCVCVFDGRSSFLNVAIKEIFKKCDNGLNRFMTHKNSYDNTSEIFSEFYCYVVQILFGFQIVF
jgi:hypothetical protein